MLEARLRKARRLLDLHRDLQRLEEERIAGLRRRQDELAVLQEEIFNSLNGDEGLQGLFTPMIVRRLKSLGDESLRVAEELKRRSEALLAISARTKHAERLAHTYEQGHNRASAERELRDIIERIARPEDASLP
ncbi:MAG: hypothetical protein WC684_02635 [Hyphomicrobium sp.]|jgi:hypothetical protein|nr:hypothetical protein [Devosia sp.]